MPHLLILTSTFPRWINDSEPGFVFELSRRLVDTFDVTVLTPRTPDSEDMEVMAGLQVMRYPYFFRHLENLTSHGGGILSRLKHNPINYLLLPFFMGGQLWATFRLIRRKKFDVIHAHWIIPQALVIILAMFMAKKRIPFICTSHGGDLYALQGKIFQKIKGYIIKRSGLLTVVSHAMKNTVVEMGIPSKKINIIPMGVDLENLFVPFPETMRDHRSLLFVGRLVEKKGVHILLKAMPIILEKYPEIYLNIVGSGPLENDLRRLANDLGIIKKVNFMGMMPQSELPSLYQNAGLAVFPFVKDRNGDQEGLGLVIVEAMGCACPVIASDLPAIKDTVIHKDTGLIVSSSNFRELADMVVKALEYPILQKKMANRARLNVIKHFDWKIITKKYLECLQQNL